MRRNINNNDNKKRTILTISCIVLDVVCVLLLLATCSHRHNPPPIGPEDPNVTIIGPAQISAESANFMLLYENNYPVQNVYWSILEGSQYATINHVTGELKLNSNAYNSNITLQVYFNNQSTTYNVLGTYEEGKIVKIDTETYKPIVVTEPRNPDIPKVPDIKPSPMPDYYPDEPSLTDTHDSGQGKMAISISALVILLISYVVAKVKSKKGELVITANAIDKILILTAPVLCFIAWCPGIDHELSAFQITLFSLSGLMLQGSIIFSITANKGNALNISLSIMAKLFVFILTFFLLLLFVAILVITFMLSAMSHSRYEGTFVMKYDHFLDQWVGYRID